jgi:nuclear cap-binding protein subunit 1
MLEKDAEVVNPEAPDPVWQYEAQDSALHGPAVDLLRRMKNKAPSHEVKNFITDLPDAMDQGGQTLLQAPIVQMVAETVLKLGDRSFSHFLNATERYLEVLRFITGDAPSRRVVLDAIANFWRRSPQMRLITADKYLQYGVLEPLDVVDWVFADDASSDSVPDGWTDATKWELLRMTLDKVVGRVVRERRRLRAVDKADEVARARRAAERLERGEGVGMDEDEDDAPRSREAQDVQAQVDVQTGRLERVFGATVRRFAEELLPFAYGRDGAGLKAVLALVDAGDAGGWPMRARWGWWREFVRRYAAHIEPLADGIEGAVFVDLPESSGLEARAEAMVRGVWADALGRE